MLSHLLFSQGWPLTRRWTVWKNHHTHYFVTTIHVENPFQLFLLWKYHMQPQRDNTFTSMLWSISGGGPEVDLLPLPPPRPLPPLPPRPRPLFAPWTNIAGVVPPESTRTCTPSCPGIPTFADTIVTLFRGVSVPVPGEWGGLGEDGRFGEYWMVALP